MVCDDCTKQLSTISAPDPWKQGSSSGGPGRLVNENKLLRKGIRSNPYSNSCKICKLKCQQNNAIYCTICAYAKGLCSICGKGGQHRDLGRERSTPKPGKGAAQFLYF